LALLFFQFAKAAGCVIFPAMEEACVLVPDEQLTSHLPEDVPHKFTPIPVASGEELLLVLNNGYEAWLAFRNRVPILLCIVLDLFKYLCTRTFRA
jgi:hypothetical protein